MFVDDFHYMPNGRTRTRTHTAALQLRRTRTRGGYFVLLLSHLPSGPT